MVSKKSGHLYEKRLILKVIQVKARGVNMGGQEGTGRHRLPSGCRRRRHCQGGGAGAGRAGCATQLNGTAALPRFLPCSGNAMYSSSACAHQECLGLAPCIARLAGVPAASAGDSPGLCGLPPFLRPRMHCILCCMHASLQPASMRGPDLAQWACTPGICAAACLSMLCCAGICAAACLSMLCCAGICAVLLANWTACQPQLRRMP